MENRKIDGFNENIKFEMGELQNAVGIFYAFILK